MLLTSYTCYIIIIKLLHLILQAHGFVAVHSSNSSIFEVDKSLLKCVPDKVFTYDHNICYCNENGTEITCKRKIYSTITPELHRIQLQNVTIQCVPGKYFHHVRKDCLCHESGKYASCLYSPCSKQELALETPDKCTPGSVFNKQCNACICGSEGKAACTKLNCRAFAMVNSGIQCVPNSHLMLGCNDCDCTKTGKISYCNKMGCAPMSFYHQHVLNMTINCTAKSIFEYNCHHCYCDENGNYAMCSGIPCPESLDSAKVENTIEQCNPGMIFANDCNICICDNNSKGICTTFSCDTIYRFKYVNELNFALPND